MFVSHGKKTKIKIKLASVLALSLVQVLFVNLYFYKNLINKKLSDFRRFFVHDSATQQSEFIVAKHPPTFPHTHSKLIFLLLELLFLLELRQTLKIGKAHIALVDLIEQHDAK